MVIMNVGRVVAVQNSKRSGWQLYKTALSLEAYAEQLRSMMIKYENIVEVVEIKRNFTVGELKNEDAETLFQIEECGWIYDLYEGYWFAPHTLPEYMSREPLIKEIYVDYKTSMYGWLPCVISVNYQSVIFYASNVFDPFWDLMEWLEAIADGKAPELRIAIEGGAVELKTFQSSDLTQIALIIIVPDRYTKLDRSEIRLKAVLDRYLLVDAFYTNFKRYINSQAYDPYDWSRFTLRELWNLQHAFLITDKAVRVLTEEDLTQLCSCIYFIDELSYDFVKSQGKEIVAFVRSRVRGEGLESVQLNPDSQSWVDLPAEFFLFTREEKIQFLNELLDEVASWASGHLLYDVQSKKVEDWLEARRDKK
uniref:Uncharacterized protein n=1 Tax=Magnetococcus massalia (strain MO-1) TaxID=451514 RepID=A0A1S7LEB7_MAGMO|nr:Protein of unknown function [Candidatus Magnetococcus massalia]